MQKIRSKSHKDSPRDSSSPQPPHGQGGDLFTSLPEHLCPCSHFHPIQPLRGAFNGLAWWLLSRLFCLLLPVLCPRSTQPGKSWHLSKNQTQTEAAHTSSVLARTRITHPDQVLI